MMRFLAVLLLVSFSAADDEDVYTFEADSCGRPNIPGGIIAPFSASYSVSSTISVSCQSGKVIQGANILQCLGYDSWSNRLPRCDVGCPFPEIENGRFSPDLRIFKDSFRESDSVSFICNAGYRISGSSTARCSSSGSWSPRIPTCIIDMPEYTIGCRASFSPSFEISPKPTRSSGIYDVGTVVTMMCKPGLVISGFATSRCQADGTWSNTMSSCKPGCRSPVFPFGYPTIKLRDEYDYYGVGDVVSFACNEGYEMTPTSARAAECTGDGTWSKRLPTCDFKPRTPPPPTGCEIPFIENGSARPSRMSYEFGDLLTISCNAGYSRQRQFITCTGNNVWDAPAIVCKYSGPPRDSSRGCFPPVFPDGTYMRPLRRGESKYPVGEKLTFKCPPSYRLRGSQYGTCQENGKWNQVPICQDGCKPQTIENGRISPPLPYGRKYYNFDTEIELRCDAGYSQVGAGRARCTLAGIWSAVLRCSDVCQAPKIPYMTTLPATSTGIYKVGNTVTFRCDIGYVLNGPKRAMCKSGNKWDISVYPKCVAIKRVYCHSPPNLNIGSFNPMKKVYTIGEKITWSCRQGHKLEGTRVSTCLNTGRFSPINQKCKQVNIDLKPDRPTQLIFNIQRNACYRPSLPKGLLIKPRQLFYPLGKEVKFVCQSGYHMVGSAVGICRRAGFGNIPRCEPQKCKQPHLPRNTQFVDLKDVYYKGDKVEYVCNQNYIMKGQSQLVCQANGQFSPYPPSCLPPSCRLNCDYVKGRSCQCDIDCPYNMNCCKDFDQYCRKLFY